MKKYVFSIVMAVFAFIAVLPMRAQAESSKADAVEFAAGTEGVSVKLILPRAAKEETASLQLKLKVESAGSGVINEVSFKFSDKVEKRAKVKEYRYHDGISTLNLYIAGTEALFEKNEDTLTLGTIIVKDRNGKAVSVKTGVPEKALTLVEGTQERTIDLVDAADIPQGGNSGSGSGSGDNPGTPGDGSNPGTPGTPGDGTTPGTPGDGTTPGTPGDGTTPGTPGDGSNPGGSDPGSGDNSGNTGNGGNTGSTGNPGSSGTQSTAKKLKDTLKKAKTYPKDKYTSKSYKALEKAKKKAKKVLNDPNATEEERQAALRALENAIGALEPAGTQSTADKEKQRQAGQARQARTGDTSQPLLYALIALLSVLVGTLGVYLRKYYHI